MLIFFSDSNPISKNLLSVKYKKVIIFVPAHEDSIWTVAWGTSDKDGTENIVTGAVDDMVKCWRW